MRYLIDRARERSTWLGLTGLISALGLALSPDQIEAIVAAGTAVAGLIGVLGRDRPSGD
ncbi:MAG: hypothetical protein ISP41_12645 [Alphaproteobacteria bacterium]|jgi:hypothetical protein|nr:hypothetical protein [Alphaproteobacteria bacterium]